MSIRATHPVARFFQASPLRHARFRLFYFGSVAVALGYTTQATVAAWLMATLTPSALMVALVQTASTLPTLLFGLAAGALADIIERRRIIVATQVLLIAATAAIGVAELLGVLGPVTLLLGTFVIGAGFTFCIPAQQASINDLVERADLPGALGLGAAAFNVARAVGPALAGGIAAWLGSGSAFLTSAAFFAVMIFAVRGWKVQESSIPGVPDTLFSGIRSGLRYARHSPPMRALIGRNLSFAICASALWALLPVIARDQLGLGAGGFGMLSASFISTVIGTKLPGPGCIYVAQSLRFKAPVRAGDTVLARVTITKLIPEKRMIELKTLCTIGEKVVIDGEATILVPARQH